MSSKPEDTGGDERVPTLIRAVPSSSYRDLLLRSHSTPLPFSDQVTTTEAALILGCPVSTVRRLVSTARMPDGSRGTGDALSRTNVETLATEVYSWRLHLDDTNPYWITGQRAADTLRLSRARLSQLAAENRVPFVRHQDGTRLYRRAQLEKIASSGYFGRRAPALQSHDSEGATPSGG